MSVNDLTAFGNPASPSTGGATETVRQSAEKLVSLAEQLRSHVLRAVEEADSFDQTERKVWKRVREIGFEAMQLFVSLQGDGDLGEQAADKDDRRLVRSTQPADTVVRSIFGQHEFNQFTYSRGKNKTIELRPVSARMQLPEHRWSYLLQEFSQIFVVDQAFRQAADNLQEVFGGKYSVDTVEQTNRRMGADADRFLDRLPTPARKEEGELLVATADCKGVPLVKEDAAKTAAFETARKRPGNRRMATVTSVYSVDRCVRTAESIVAALFRDEPDAATASTAERPRPQHKHTTAHLPTIEIDGDAAVQISGIHEGTAWLAGQVEARIGDGQTLVVVMDGQESLWDAAESYLGCEDRRVSILDFLHAAVYIWEAAALFHHDRADREAFTRQRLLSLLRGEVSGVIRGLRRMGSIHNLCGEPLKELTRIAGYLEKHRLRMKYDEYLREGYPIASGVIEGACRHLVKDRMERSGMRWTLEGARSMLNVRAVFQSDHWQTFQTQRITKHTAADHPHRNLLADYQPLRLAT